MNPQPDWSDNKPTEVGYYWYMWCGNVVMCEVWYDENQRLCSKIVNGERTIYVEYRYGQWWYPRIEKPAPPPVKPETENYGTCPACRPQWKPTC